MTSRPSTVNYITPLGHDTDYGTWENLVTGLIGADKALKLSHKLRTVKPLSPGTRAENDLAIKTIANTSRLALKASSIMNNCTLPMTPFDSFENTTVLTQLNNDNQLSTLHVPHHARRTFESAVHVLYRGLPASIFGQIRNSHRNRTDIRTIHHAINALRNAARDINYHGSSIDNQQAMIVHEPPHNPPARRQDRFNAPRGRGGPARQEIRQQGQQRRNVIRPALVQTIDSKELQRPPPRQAPAQGTHVITSVNHLVNPQPHANQGKCGGRGHFANDCATPDPRGTERVHITADDTGDQFDNHDAAEEDFEELYDEELDGEDFTKPEQSRAFPMSIIAEFAGLTVSSPATLPSATSKIHPVIIDNGANVTVFRDKSPFLSLSSHPSQIGTSSSLASLSSSHSGPLELHFPTQTLTIPFARYSPTAPLNILAQNDLERSGMYFLSTDLKPGRIYQRRDPTSAPNPSNDTILITCLKRFGLHYLPTSQTHHQSISSLALFSNTLLKQCPQTLPPDARRILATIAKDAAKETQLLHLRLGHASITKMEQMIRDRTTADLPITPWSQVKLVVPVLL
ncbi:hypothetical protein BC829DRAFT_422034 [Chytridium lagenaria]|nr:hypothetical protein BC829DRAFT_422034 [Chytridium lagenaria]